MNRFWQRYIHPLIETAQPRTDHGNRRGSSAGTPATSSAYCRATGAHADIIDPAPLPSLHEVLAQFGPPNTATSR
jgi:hypothetical protein